VPKLAAAYRQIRGRSEELCEPLSAEDCQVQSMPDASPAKWHLAHTSWFFETFVLEKWLPAYRTFCPEFRVLFNSYYQSVGKQHPRPRRGLLTRPSLDEVVSYRKYVDEAVVSLFDKMGEADEAQLDLIELGLHHEQQHQELMLTDVKHLLSCNPLRPAYRDCPSPPRCDPQPMRWHGFEEGVRWIGHDGRGFAFDNEQPRHRTFVHSFELASRLATNGEFVAFVKDKGYARPDLWLSDAWSVVERRGWQFPLYWEQRDDVWFTQTLSGPRELRLDEPVTHISFYEADAFARWSNARLPSETEWELAAGDTFKKGNFVETGLLHPAPAPAHQPAQDIVQLFGDVWEWTRSPYGPYPGYEPPQGALGEYNGKFMSNQMVLRGGSCATPASHTRATYRNFFPPDARWQFSGIRLARDAS
jgi:ergothioneine biosynthesis protein EgtB